MPNADYQKDFLGDFLGGVDSGIDPHLLPKNKLAWLVNGSVRGGFMSPRPKYLPQNLTGNAALITALKAGLFQGAAFYKPNSTSVLPYETLFAMISGRLFGFTPDNLGNCAVAEFTDVLTNSTTATQAWLQQAENYLIVQDGTTPNPMVFDGTKTFRSYSAQTTIAEFNETTTQIIPAVGSTISIAVGTDILAAIPSQYYNIPVALFSSAIPTVFLGQMTFTAIPASNNPYGAILVSTGGHTVNVGDVVYVQTATYNQVNNTDPIAGGNVDYSTTLTVPTADAYNDQLVTGFVAGTLYAKATVAQYAVPIGAPYGTPAQPTGKTQVVTSSAITPSMIQATSFTVPLPSDPYGTGSIITSLTLYYTTQSGAPTYSYTPIATVAAPLGGATSYVCAPGSPTPVVFANNYSYPTSSTQALAVFIGPNSATPGSNASLQISSYTPSGTVSYFLTNQTCTPGAVLNLQGCSLTTLVGIPCGEMFTYSQGRLWTALPDGRSFVAGDIVGGSSGTAANQFKDAILYTMENTLLVNGGTFSTPGNNGVIRAMLPAPTLDASLGQGPLQVFCTDVVFSCSAPADITTWASVTSPIVTESLIGSGGLSQAGTIMVNGDILFRSQDGIRSLTLSRLDFNKWANTPISREVGRVIDYDNPELLNSAPAALFDNRILFGADPVQGTNGVMFQDIIAINLDTVSNLQTKAPAVYDGVWQNLNVLQFVTGIFGNRVRCFAFVSDGTNIGVTEILASIAGQDIAGTTATTWQAETSVIFNKNEDGRDMMRLEDGEVYAQNIMGMVNFTVEFRSDYDMNWHPWYSWSIDNTQGNKPYHTRMGLGVPTGSIGSTTNRQNRDGYTFQFRITITGNCTFMGMMVKTSPVPDTEFAKPLTSIVVTPPVPVSPLLRNLFIGTGTPSATPASAGGIWYDFSTGTEYFFDGREWVGPSTTLPNGEVIGTGYLPSGSTSVSLGVQAFAGNGPPTTQHPANNAGTYYDFLNKALYFWNPAGYWDGLPGTGTGPVVANTLGQDYLGGNGPPGAGVVPANNAGIYYDLTGQNSYNWNPLTQLWE